MDDRTRTQLTKIQHYLWFAEPHGLTATEVASLAQQGLAYERQGVCYLTIQARRLLRETGGAR